MQAAREVLTLIDEHWAARVPVGATQTAASTRRALSAARLHRHAVLDREDRGLDA